MRRQVIAELYAAAFSAVQLLASQQKLRCASHRFGRSVSVSGFKRSLGDPGNGRRSIIVLESNTGYSQLHGMLMEAGDRSLARPSAVRSRQPSWVFASICHEHLWPRH